MESPPPIPWPGSPLSLPGLLWPPSPARALLLEYAAFPPGPPPPGRMAPPPEPVPAVGGIPADLGRPDDSGPAFTALGGVLDKRGVANRGRAAADVHAPPEGIAA